MGSQLETSYDISPHSQLLVMMETPYTHKGLEASYIKITISEIFNARILYISNVEQKNYLVSFGITQYQCNLHMIMSI